VDTKIVSKIIPSILLILILLMVVVRAAIGTWEILLVIFMLSLLFHCFFHPLIPLWNFLVLSHYLGMDR